MQKRYKNSLKNNLQGTQRSTLHEVCLSTAQDTMILVIFHFSYTILLEN
jgi:hypothetical protein